MRGLATAITFLTRIPLGWPRDYREDDLARATPWFPVVGAGIGAALGGAALGLHTLGLSPGLSVALGVLSLGPLLTGALHEDGLADTADGLGGGRDRESALRIFRDSRVGAYGVVAVVVAFALRLEALRALEPAQWLPALLLAHALGRWSTLLLMAALPYARQENKGLADRMVPGLGWGRSVLAFGVVVGLCGALLGPMGGLLLLGAGILTLLLGLWFRRRLGGITGDLLGAACVGTELLVLAGFGLL
ncbi:MAG: adenosylcobinamide-GDP ribazoletransferase [Myxococcota bacterium]|nr:adenosylcobinamide-GDP ribazoletransferase [Myxococcota bacterium]